MFDIALRPLKDGLFDPCCRYVPKSITPLHITLAAFLSGLLSCYFASTKASEISLPLLFWAMNRALDCLDGALARYRGIASDLGGFLDLLGDFIVYSFIPIAIAQGSPSADTNTWRAVAVLEATFHVNNFVLFFIAAVVEKTAKEAREDRSGTRGKNVKKEVTSVVMKPALIEGMESGLIFTAMLAVPSTIRELSWIMAGLVTVGIIQRTIWGVCAL